MNIEVFDRCCLRSTPEDAEELRARYDSIRPAWHMNKRLWDDVYLDNQLTLGHQQASLHAPRLTVDFNQDVPDDVILQLVRNSYDLIVAKLTKRERENL